MSQPCPSSSQQLAQTLLHQIVASQARRARLHPRSPAPTTQHLRTRRTRRPPLTHQRIKVAAERKSHEVPSNLLDKGHKEVKWEESESSLTASHSYQNGARSRDGVEIPGDIQPTPNKANRATAGGAGKRNGNKTVGKEYVWYRRYANNRTRALMIIRKFK
jgi:hypothetical protein